MSKVTRTLLLLLVCATAASSADNDTLPYRKCCPELEGLAKVTDEVLGVYYRCMNRREVNRRMNGTSALAGTFVVGNSSLVTYGFPEMCTPFQLVESEYTAISYSPERYCLDKVVIHLANESIPEAALHEDVVALGCDSDMEDDLGRIKMERLRKCCPDGYEYDANGLVCQRSDEVAESLESVVRRFVGHEGLHEVQIGLQCKSGQYSLSFVEGRFELTYEGRLLAVRDRISGDMYRLHREEYCVDRLAGSGDGGTLVARGCMASCVEGVSCVRKCCPPGQHHVPRVCGRGANKCVPGEHPFSPPFYTGRYMAYHETSPPELIGIRPPPVCEEGRYALSNSTEDEHFLMSGGEMVVPKIYKFYPTDVYCLETVDRTMCPGGGVTVETILCFQKPTNLPFKFTVSVICIFISCVFLLLTLVVYAALPELRNLHGMTLMCHVASMLLGYSCLARVQSSHIEMSSLCKLHGYVIYFAFVAAFSWLCVMCFDIWWTFGSVKTVQRIRKSGADRRRFLWYSLCAWGIPVVLTVTVLMLDLYPVTPYLDANIGQNFCWFGSIQNDATDWPHYIFFVVPMGLVTGVNLVLWVCTARHCARVKSELHRMQAGSFGDRAKLRFQADRAKYTLVVKLWVVMGAGWVWEVLSTLVEEPRWLWLGVDVINELQGLFIFIILVLKPKVFFLIRKRLGLEKDAVKDGTARPTSTRSTFLSRSMSSEERAQLRVSHNQPPPPPTAAERRSLSATKSQ